MSKEEVHYFYEDEVFRVRRNGSVQFGMVVENSEFLSSDEEEDEDERLKKGTIRVAWHPKGDVEVVKETSVGLLDRSLMPGDVVRRLIVGRDTQRGYCRDLTVRAVVEIVASPLVIVDVPSKDLRPLEDFALDIAVCLDSWVGMIKEINSKITVKFSDGSTCQLDDNVAEELEDVLDKRDSDCEFKRYECYPGQLLVGPIELFEDGHFTHCTDELQNLRNSGKPNKQLRVTVEKVEVASLGIHWQYKAYSRGTGLSDVVDKQPDYTVSGEDLKRVKMLNVFEPCTLQIGDRNYYTIKESDLILTRDEWKVVEKETLLGSSSNNLPKKKKEAKKVVETESDSDQEEEASGKASKKRPVVASSSISVTSTTLGKKKKKLRRSRKKSESSGPSNGPQELIVRVNPGDKVIVEVLGTKSDATVIWQDGSVEKDVSSVDLFPIHALDDQEFFPGDFVVRASNNEVGQNAYDPHSYGVVQKVDHSGRTCSVKWFRTYTIGSDPQPLYVATSEEPVYDLRDHPDFKYRPGSIVIRVANFVDANEDSSDINEFDGSTGGQVLNNYTSGKVLVWWANNSTSACWPQDLYKIGEYDSDEGELWEDDDDEDDEDGSQASWETESEHSVDEIITNPEEEVNLRPKLAANIEKARIAMTRLEEICCENPTLQTGIVMKQLLDVYKNCKDLDRLMGTTFFEEANFEGLVEKIRERSRVSSAQQAVQAQVSRLFSQGEEESKKSESPSPHKSPKLDNEVLRPNSRDSGHDENLADSDIKLEDVEQSNCARLCALIKAQLGKSHEEVMRRYGGQEANFTAEDLAQSPGEEEQDLEGVMDQMFHATISRFENLAFRFLQGPADEATEPLLPPICTEEVTTPIKSEVSNYDISTALYGTPEEQKKVQEETASADVGEFSMLENAPSIHKFKLSVFQPNDPKNFLKFVRKEVKLLRTSLPPGIHVRGFEDRMDLYSVMITGPERTPYEDGLFFFDFQLSADYPKAPPVCHYHSYVSDRLNPNLYEDGKVCVSLLGTWSGKGTETWTPNSNMLQLLVSIQGLILVSEPYFNEAGYERQKGTQQGHENSRMYNEMVVLKLVQSLTRLAHHPPETFKAEVKQHLTQHAHRLVARLEGWRKISEATTKSLPLTTPTENEEEANSINGEGEQHVVDYLPEFPLVPASKGFCLSLQKSLDALREALAAMGIVEKQE